MGEQKFPPARWRTFEKWLQKCVEFVKSAWAPPSARGRPVNLLWTVGEFKWSFGAKTGKSQNCPNGAKMVFRPVGGVGKRKICFPCPTEKTCPSTTHSVMTLQLQNPDCIEEYEKEYHEACRGRGVGMKSESQVIHI